MGPLAPNPDPRTTNLGPRRPRCPDIGPEAPNPKLRGPILTSEASNLVKDPQILTPGPPILALKAPTLAPEAPILVQAPQILASDALITFLALFVWKLWT